MILTVNQVFGLARHIVPDRMRETNLLINSLAANLLVVVRVERQVSAEHEVRDNTDRPAIDTLVIEFLREDLGCHVAQRTKWLIARLVGTERLGEAKVDELDRRLKRVVHHEDVLRLEISVRNTERVQIVDGC